MNRITELKVKLLSLAAEAVIIKREEYRARAEARRQRRLARTCEAAYRRGEHHEQSRIYEHEKQAHAATTTFWSLRAHRYQVVKTVARETQLAYGFLRGRPYRGLERTCRRPPSWSQVWSTIQRFSPAADHAKFVDWCSEPAALAHAA